MEITFTVDGQPINRVTEFRYLGLVVEENDDDNHAPLRQLARARQTETKLLTIWLASSLILNLSSSFSRRVPDSCKGQCLDSFTTSSGYQEAQLEHAVYRYIHGIHVQVLDCSASCQLLWCIKVHNQEDF